jgi:hypothetical protein
MAPLGPITRHLHWVRVYDGAYRSEGWELDATTYRDQLGREYNSIEHVLRCAIAKELSDVAHT